MEEVFVVVNVVVVVVLVNFLENVSIHRFETMMSLFRLRTCLKFSVSKF